jgi:hypothetical protein
MAVQLLDIISVSSPIHYQMNGVTHNFPQSLQLHDLEVKSVIRLHFKIYSSNLRHISPFPLLITFTARSSYKAKKKIKE